MLVTITEYRHLKRDDNGNFLPLGTASGITIQSRTSAGAFSALQTSTKIIRIATDTNITLDINSSAVDELYMAGVEFRGVAGGEVLTIATA